MTTPKDAQRKISKLARLARTPLFRAGLRLGVAATVEHESIPLMPSARTVIDVGAHTGQFALFARERYPDATIHCFEPQSDVHARLAAIARLAGNVQLHPTAVGDRSGDATLHLSRRSDSSSLLPIGSGQVESFPGTAGDGTRAVPVVTLDQALDVSSLTTPCLMKVDVQGYELAVIRGGTKQVLPRVDELLVEVSFVELYVGQPLASEVLSYIRSLGFELNGVYGVAYGPTGQSLQADVLFTRSPVS